VVIVGLVFQPHFLRMITASEVKERIDYDAETGRLIWIKSPSARAPVGSEAGTPSGCGYRQVKFNGIAYKAHRLIWLMQTGEWPEHEIDHINGDRADNRWSNLRAATTAQNKQNLAKRTDNSTGATGVHWDKRINRWFGQIHANGKQHYLGSFDSKEEAAAAYAAAKARLHTFQPVARPG
jgi:hypothetical protein